MMAQFQRSQPGTRIRARLCAAVLLVAGIAGMTPAYGDNSEASEAEELVQLDQQLGTHGDGSLGDMVDLHTGTLSFSQTDVSLPGNSKLPVSVVRRFDPGRRRSLSYGLASDFYTWSIDLPRITTTLATAAPWPNNRCSTYWTDRAAPLRSPR